MNLILPSDWDAHLKSETEKTYFKDLEKSLTTAYKKRTVYPEHEDIFKALELTPLSDVKVVILGQDPYHGPGQAHGLSFSVQGGAKIPPSLNNIYKELKSALGKEIPESGNLSHWAYQGVLLLNSTLTVEDGEAGSHQGWGWETFTDAIIETISKEKEHVVFLLWGKYAQSKKKLIDTDKHLVLETAHPSPLSARRGFFGSKQFKKTNEYLKEHGLTEIDW